MSLSKFVRSRRTAVLGLTIGLFAVIGLSGYTLLTASQMSAGFEASQGAISKAPNVLRVAEFSHAPLLADGEEVYTTRCMSCHQMNGRGVPGVFPPLAESEWVTEDKGMLIRIVLNGVTGEVKVGGETYSGAMPPWQSFLDDQQVASLLTYIRTSWGNDASEVTEDEVAKVRAAVADRKTPWTSEELLQAENQGIPGEDSTATSG